MPQCTSLCEQLPAGGIEGQAADVVGRQFADGVDDGGGRIDDGQAAAERIGHDQFGSLADQHLLARREGKRDRMRDAEGGR
jgi:hypothetical protein